MHNNRIHLEEAYSFQQEKLTHILQPIYEVIPQPMENNLFIWPRIIVNARQRRIPEVL